MGIRQELAALAAEAAANAPPEEAPQGEKKRKGGTAKFKKGSMVLVPHTDQVGRQVAAGLTVGLAGWLAWVVGEVLRRCCFATMRCGPLAPAILGVSCHTLPSTTA